MPQYELDPIESAEIMELLGASHLDVDDPKRYHKLRDIVLFFQKKANKREQILRILSDKPGVDSLDTVWTWVQLIQERSQKIRSLDKEMFEENVVNQIEADYITRDKIKFVKKQIDERLKVAAKKAKEREAAKRQEEKTEKKKSESVDKVMDTTKLLEAKKTLEEVESINNLLNEY